MGPGAPRAPVRLLLALGALLWPSASAWELTILHTNDVHSRLEQTSEDSTKCINASLCVGGVARLFTKVQQIRQAEPNVLLLDAGDQYQGTIWFTVYKGAEVAHFMNALRYDAMVRPELRARSPRQTEEQTGHTAEGPGRPGDRDAERSEGRGRHWPGHRVGARGCPRSPLMMVLR